MTQERILIIDGDITLSERLKTRLEALGYLVDCACNGNEALEALKAKWVDLIVLAVILQDGMDGLQLFKEIRAKKEFSKIPIAIQSKKPAMKAAFESLGSAIFFIKPYPMDVFLGEIKDILTKKVLILSDEANTVSSLSKFFSGHDYRVDVLSNPHRFYVNISSYRYSLIVLQSKIRTTMADMLISLVKRSYKNKNIPIIVYLSAKELPPGKIMPETLLLKKKCDKLKNCEFMEKGYSQKNFVHISKKYLDFG